jgi:hypothetical protein
MPLIRARDLRTNIKEMGFERGVVTTLERMLDEMAEMRQHVRQTIELVDRCIVEVEKLATIGGQMHDVIEQMRRDHTHGDEHGEQS